MLSVREWIAAQVAANMQPAEEVCNCFEDFEDRQLRVVSEAAERRFLLDPSPPISEYTNQGVDARDPGFAWNLRRLDDLDLTSGADILHPLQERWERMLREAGARLPRGSRIRRDAFLNAREPGHFSLWRDYCAEVLQRPPVLVGRFGPFHVCPPGSEDVLGVLVTSRAETASFTIQPAAWKCLLALISPVVACARRWLFFDGSTLAVEVPLEDAEHLGACICDILEEEGWQPSHPGHWSLALNTDGRVAIRRLP